MKIHFSIRQISFGTLARLCGGELFMTEASHAAVTHLCTDSREADPDTAFVALRGDRVDGHDYIPAAIANGCRCVICEHRTQALADSGIAAIVVGDSELALSHLANAYRSYLSCKTVGITGSVGKTTTKDLVASVLSRAYPTCATPGNHNSLVGMPMSMLEITTDARYAVLEMGMSNFGEIERLSITACPQIAVITRIGSSHLSSMGNRENIARAKLEILSGLSHGGVLLLNGDDRYLENISGKSYRTLYVSTERENADFFADNIDITEEATVFDIIWNGGRINGVKLHLMGRHNVYAGLYAFAVGLISGMDPEAIREGLWSYRPSGLRQHVYPLGEMTVIEDCYNASPESMTAAVENLACLGRQKKARTVAILGDMKDLGQESPDLHRSVGSCVAAHGIDLLFTLGKGGRQITVGARQGGMHKEQLHHTPDERELEKCAAAVLACLRPGDLILCKASRAVGAERILEIIKQSL